MVNFINLKGNNSKIILANESEISTTILKLKYMYRHQKGFENDIDYNMSDLVSSVSMDKEMKPSTALWVNHYVAKRN